LTRFKIHSKTIKSHNEVRFVFVLYCIFFPLYICNQSAISLDQQSIVSIRNKKVPAVYNYLPNL